MWRTVRRGAWSRPALTHLALDLLGATLCVRLDLCALVPSRRGPRCWESTDLSLGRSTCATTGTKDGQSPHPMTISTHRCDAILDSRARIASGLAHPQQGEALTGPKGFGWAGEGFWATEFATRRHGRTGGLPVACSERPARGPGDKGIGSDTFSKDTRHRESKDRVSGAPTGTRGNVAGEGSWPRRPSCPSTAEAPPPPVESWARSG